MGKVQSIDRALNLLEVLAERPDGMSITELSQQLDLAKSTTHRLLFTLLERNYVEQDETTAMYSLGLRCVALSTSMLNSIDIRKIARDSLVELSERSKEVVHLCIHDKNEAVYIDKVESDQTIRMYSQVGRRVFMHCSGVGKALLSGFEKEEVDSLINEKGLPRFTKTTITDREALHKHLQLIRERGYAIDENEHEKGIRCIAAPIYDFHGKVIAAISIAGPADRVTKERVHNELAKLILEKTSEVSAKVGYTK